MNDDVLVKYLAGEATAEEQHAIKAWRLKDEQNERYFRHFKMIWEGSTTLVPPHDVDETEAWERFRLRVKTDHERSPAISTRAVPAWLKIAAGILLVGSVVAICFSLFFKPAAVVLVQRQSGQHVRTDTLPDGSTVTLNRNSSLSYPSRFAGDNRMVKVNGEAFFNVEPNKDKPFIVQVNDVTVKVLGTSFNIKSREGQTEVIVESGVVQVAKANDRVELKAGEKVITREKGSLSKGLNESELYNAYMSRKFVCRNTPLAELIEAVSDAYNVDIRIASGRLESLRINTTFENDSLEDILEVISETFIIQIERQGGEIILK